MTLIEAINRINVLKPNTYSQEEKVSWLSTIDGIIKKEIIDTHEGADDVVFNGYDEFTDLSTVLLVPEPYEDVYLRWLEAQIDYANGEYARYNNVMKAYNNAYSSYFRYYNKTHMPLGKKFKFF